MAEDTLSYHELLEECKNIYTELSYNARFTRIAMYHLIGKTLLENENVVVGKLTQFAHALHVDPYDLATAILLANRYPDLNDFQHDKTISWSQIRGILNEEDQAE